MASLDLQPNIQIMAAQAVVFAANFYVVKKFFVAPYLKLKEKKERVTIGQKDEAQLSIQKCHILKKKIEDQLKASRDEMEEFCNNEKNEAITQKNELLASTKKEVEASLKKVRTNITETMREESKKVEALAKPLAEEVFQKVLN